MEEGAVSAYFRLLKVCGRFRLQVHSSHWIGLDGAAEPNRNPGRQPMASPRSFYENLRSGVPAPPVDADDLKRVWEFVKAVRRRGETDAVRHGGSVGIQADLLAEHCSPGANVPAVMFRCQFLQLVVEQGLLAPWLHGGEPDEFLFQVFAAYPVHVGEFDTASLLRHIRENSPG